MENKTRRDFLKNSAQLIGIGIGSSALVSVLNSCEEFIQKDSKSSNITINIDLSKESQEFQDNLKQQGVGVIKSFGKYNYGIPLIILRLTPTSLPIEEAKFAAYSSMCTHDHCIIHNSESELPSGYWPDDSPLKVYRLIHCNCHGSAFDPFNHGIVFKGPAEKSLREFPVEYDYTNNILKITF